MCSRDGHLKSKKEQCNSSNEQSNDNTCTRDKGDKNFQVEKCVHKWPKKLQKDVQLKKPAAKDKNCQVKIGYTKQKKCEYDDFKSQCSRCYDKNCQEIKRPKKPRNVMQSVTKERDMWLPKPARLCSDKNCQSTRCCSLRSLKKQSPRRPMYD